MRVPGYGQVTCPGCNLTSQPTTAGMGSIAPNKGQAPNGWMYGTMREMLPSSISKWRSCNRDVNTGVSQQAWDPEHNGSLSSPGSCWIQTVPNWALGIEPSLDDHLASGIMGCEKFPGTGLGQATLLQHRHIVTRPLLCSVNGGVHSSHRSLCCILQLSENRSHVTAHCRLRVITPRYEPNLYYPISHVTLFCPRFPDMKKGSAPNKGWKHTQ